ncbi:MAG: D-alanyl-D-alanine carboxypeptidase/D-alanyl-D-alanine-endopeptidase [Rhodobacteraceae bacterium]|nr:MAG: D-alanyl-D-alanine carboxypeptidase/D-alanyl-D-alanine-endopeptidase [Paracoccaceae bacterium]
MAVADAAALVRAANLSGDLGLIVIDAATGETLEALNADRALAPASVAKLPTALYALSVLGPDARFETVVRAAGRVEGGRLQGDLVLAGGGDPELDTEALAALARAAAERVGVVEGRFVADASAGAAIPAIDPTQPPEAAYNPSVGALNLNFNRVRLAWERRGGAVDVAVQAYAAGLAPPVSTVTVALAPADCACPTFALAAAEDREAWSVRESALTGTGSVFLPVRAPARYAAEVFRDAAGAAGLALPVAEVSRATVAGERLAAHRSRTTAAMTADMLRFSTNLTAESLGLAATAALGQPGADLAASGRAMADWADGVAGGRPGDGGFVFLNHSGLSGETRATPRRMAEFLRAATHAGLAALTPERRIDGAPPGARLRAKTGTMDFVRGLAGWIETPSGRTLVFAWFANDLERRDATRGMGRRPPGAIPWRDRAVELERKLIASWIARFG